MYTSWHSYPKIYNLGHPQISDLLKDPILIEEKIDGSQFSFGRFGDDLKCKSKGKELVLDAPEKMFSLAVDYVISVKHLLKDGYTYRAEYLRTSKHNCLEYSRVPENNLIVFDISPSEEKYIRYAEKRGLAKEIGLETVPCLFEGELKEASVLTDFLKLTSHLGGPTIEGVVVKNYLKFGEDKKALMGKHVSEGFKEVNKTSWKAQNPGKHDILVLLSEKYRIETRWQKAIQHLKEAGLLTGTPQDIGSLIKETQRDLKEECEKEIAEQLTAWALPHIQRKSVAGLPEWYKEQLLKNQFEVKNEEL